MRHAAVGMHRALGRARGAGGVDEDGEIVGAAAADHLVPQRLVALLVVAPERHEFGERQHHRIDKAARPSMSNTTIFCSVGQRARHDRILSSCSSSSAKITLVEESLIRYSTCTDEVGRIDAGRNAAGAQDAHVGIDPFRHRVGDDRGDVAGLEADGMQAVGDVLGDLQPLPPTGRLPDAEFLFADRRLVAARFHATQKTLRDRVGDRQHCRSGHALFLPPVACFDAGLVSRSCSRSRA